MLLCTSNWKHSPKLSIKKQHLGCKLASVNLPPPHRPLVLWPSNLLWLGRPEDQRLVTWNAMDGFKNLAPDLSGWWAGITEVSDSCCDFNEVDWNMIVLNGLHLFPFWRSTLNDNQMYHVRTCQHVWSHHRSPDQSVLHCPTTKHHSSEMGRLEETPETPDRSSKKYRPCRGVNVQSPFR